MLQRSTVNSKTLTKLGCLNYRIADILCVSLTKDRDHLNDNDQMKPVDSIILRNPTNVHFQRSKVRSSISWSIYFKGEKLASTRPFPKSCPKSGECLPRVWGPGKLLWSWPIWASMGSLERSWPNMPLGGVTIANLQRMNLASQAKKSWPFQRAHTRPYWLTP